ncbi:unnamed protein product [Trichogramma brassicae]|uniref:Uncharacterized protein n=1 Tax=Trichogramma brassicae TaxID=86971 RepID=A0A6H5IEY6_9HYME|nr:unnamed protein product [Trichogramma brassicae]
MKSSSGYNIGRVRAVCALKAENCGRSFAQLEEDKRLFSKSDEVDLQRIHEQGKLDLSLLDHHALTGDDSGLRDAVRSVIDHRPQDRDWPWLDCDLVLEQVGSCASLVARNVLRRRPSSMSELGKLLLGCCVYLIGIYSYMFLTIYHFRSNPYRHSKLFERGRPSQAVGSRDDRGNRKNLQHQCFGASPIVRANSQSKNGHKYIYSGPSMKSRPGAYDALGAADGQRSSDDAKATQPTTCKWTACASRNAADDN